MKAIIAILMLMTGVTATNVYAAKPTTIVNTQTWDVQAANGNVIIENKTAEPLEVIITGRFGEEVAKTTINNGSKKIPTKDMRLGNYNIKLKSRDKQANVKLQIL